MSPVLLVKAWRMGRDSKSVIVGFGAQFLLVKEGASWGFQRLDALTLLIQQGMRLGIKF